VNLRKERREGGREEGREEERTYVSKMLTFGNRK
jgi:hypothetical protein